MSNKTFRSVLTFLAALAWSFSAHAAVVDLTTAGSSGTINGAIYQQVPPQPTGTGFIDSFVRIQNKGAEAGYNADVRPVMPNVTTDPNFTRDIQLSEVPIINGYYQFLLDINESSGGARKLVTLHELEIWLKGTPLTSASTYAALSGSGAMKKYDMDDPPDGDSRVELDYSLNSGSGSGDMFLYIPVATLGVDGSQYVYLYSAFGVPQPSEAGFEEWAVLLGQEQAVPEAGSTAMMLGIALLAFEGVRRKLRI